MSRELSSHGRAQVRARAARLRASTLQRSRAFTGIVVGLVISLPLWIGLFFLARAIVHALH